MCSNFIAAIFVYENIVKNPCVQNTFKSPIGHLPKCVQILSPPFLSYAWCPSNSNHKTPLNLLQVICQNVCKFYRRHFCPMRGVSTKITSCPKKSAREQKKVPVNLMGPDLPANRKLVPVKTSKKVSVNAKMYPWTFLGIWGFTGTFDVHGVKTL